MAVGKAVNRKSFYGADGGAPDIAMPPLPQEIISQEAVVDNPPSMTQSITEELSQDQVFDVPDQLPDDVAAEMDIQDQDSQEVEQPRAKVASAPKTAQDSFKVLRDAKEKAERERDALMSQMMEIYQGKQPQQQQQVAQQKQAEQPAEEDFNFNIDEDALVEGKYVNKMAKELKAIKAQLKDYNSQNKEVAVEAKIRTNFPDFEKVVSKENVEMLNYQYPEVAASLRDTQDMYSKAAAAYKIMKTFGIHKDIYEEDRMKATTNAKKPRPLASVSPQQGDSPLSKANAFANGMTEELKEQLRKEMNQARKAM